MFIPFIYILYLDTLLMRISAFHDRSVITISVMHGRGSDSFASYNYPCNGGFRTFRL